MLKNGERRITGEDWLARLKEKGYIRLDANIFQTLWRNQLLIPESWQEPVNGHPRFIYFDGTVLRRPDGYRFVLCLYWYAGKWHRNYRWLDRDWGDLGPSAVLAP